MSGPVYEIDLARTANEPIAEGIHPFSVADVEEQESQNGNPMWVFSLACLSPGEEGKTVRLYLVLTPNARWKLEQFLDAVGAPTSGNVTAERFVGRKLRCQITHEDYEGRPQARIGQMWPMGSTAPVVKSTVPAGKPANNVQKTGTATKTVARQPVAETPAGGKGKGAKAVVQAAEEDIPF